MDRRFGKLLLLYSQYLSVNTMRMKKRKRPSRRSNPYLAERQSKGRFAKDDLRNHPPSFHENFHVSVESFDIIYELLKPYLSSTSTRRPFDGISGKEKLAAVLEYFASGTLQRHVASIYRISKQHFGTIIDEVCNAICHAMPISEAPMSRAEFLRTANEFHTRWQFPNCIGAIDGKHVAIKCPHRAGSMFYNYKGFHSLILMAVSDANYKFTHINVGAYGSEGDANVFSRSQFGEDIRNERIDFPEDAFINGHKLPFFFIGDDAFPLSKRIMKPYGGRSNLEDDELIFNYRISRARRCVENAFGILCIKWLCLKRTMFCSPDRAQKIIIACCLLHNYSMTQSKSSYCPQHLADRFDDNGDLIEGEWRRRVASLSDSLYGNFIGQFSGRPTNAGKLIRQHLKEYVVSPLGSIPWQNRTACIPSRGH